MAAAADRVCTWYIRHVDLFRPLTPRDADALARSMSIRQFSPGEFIITAETQPEAVYLIRAGTVRLFHPGADGNETTIERLINGELFGVTRLLGRDPGGLLAQADSEVELCMVEGRRFLDVVSRWPASALELALRLGVRFREGDELLARTSATGARARLAAVVYRLAGDSESQPGGGLRLREVPKHSELASEIGATRETVTRMLARLERDGYIRRFGRQVVVPDLARLAHDFDLRP